MEKLFLFIDGEKYGPYSLAEVEKWVIEGRIKRDTLCWYQGLSRWMPVCEVFPSLFPPKPPEAQNVKQGDTSKGGKGCCIGCFFMVLIFVIILSILGFFLWKYGKPYYRQFKYHYNSGILLNGENRKSG